MIEQEFNFDIIGVSYYPWWHGTLNDLNGNLSDLAFRYGKDLLVLETAYPWTLDWFDNVHNNVGLPEQLEEGYEASPAGQGNFYSDLLRQVYDLPYSRGVGVVLWAPDWISVPDLGSAWENLTLFDFQANLLQSVRSFETGDLNQDGQVDVVDIIQLMSFILQNADQGLELWRGDLNMDDAADIIDIVLMVDRILTE